MMGNTSSQLLAATARWTAALRARERLRSDPLFLDPWAELLAGTDGQDWLDGLEDGPGPEAIAIRTRYFDDFLQRVVTEDGIRQVVLLAAGLDTRAFRCPWPRGTRVFELDRTHLLTQKQSLLSSHGVESTCEHIAIGVDLESPWGEVLGSVGFDPATPSCWLAEGLLFYLPDDAVTRVVDQISGLAAAGSSIGFDVVSRATLTHPLTRPWLEMQAARGAAWRSGMDDPERFLAERGWAGSAVQVGDDGASYGRWPYPVPPRDVPDLPRTWLVTARRT